MEMDSTTSYMLRHYTVSNEDLIFFGLMFCLPWPGGRLGVDENFDGVTPGGGGSEERGDPIGSGGFSFEVG